MEDIILIVLMMCGKPDTLIVKEPDKAPIYTHNIRSEEVMDSVERIMKTDPIVIIYEDKRSVCI